ncbi:tyrosine-type recombinase/integrase [Halosimplex rubrum]|uniref:Tyrosine-type recombinase/integrase n=1 Tax=Halosimplex rubrum TaxID=869889 RepID=A0A7D5T4V0_9EURY|nr:tyrosine-type recombinase/integrase [Halosimplex rubrum]
MVFPSREGSDHITTETVRNVVEDLAVEADVCPRRTDGESAEPEELHPHALRHSLASYMLKDETTRLIDVRNRLRHRSIQTSERVYEHFQRR